MDVYKMYEQMADWMETQGYYFDRDPDGFWWEAEATEHRFKDIFELLYEYGEWVKSGLRSCWVAIFVVMDHNKKIGASVNEWPVKVNWWSKSCCAHNI